VQRPVGGGCERSPLPRGQPTDSELQTNPTGLDGSNPHGQLGPRHAGSAVRVRKIGRLRFATLQHWETDSATSWRYPSFVGIRGNWQQQHQVRMIPRSCGRRTHLGSKLRLRKNREELGSETAKRPVCDRYGLYPPAFPIDERLTSPSGSLGVEMEGPNRLFGRVVNLK